MTPRTPRAAAPLRDAFPAPTSRRSSTRRRRTLVALLPAAALILAACTATNRSTWLAGGQGGGSEVTESPSTSPSASASGSPSVTASPTGSGTSTGGGGGGNGNYLSRLPHFGPAPTPEPVNLPHAAGHAAWATHVPTTAKVAFLTIDDGWTKRPEAISLLQAAGIPVTLFLTTDAIQSDTGYFKQLQNLGAVIEDHTISHPSLPTLSYAGQKKELCNNANSLSGWYGRRPVIFRPPFGNKNDDTLRAAWDCGLKAGFFWKETVDKGIVRYQTSVHKIQPGDIILMHFRPAFVDDFIAALNAIKNSGLTPGLLEDWILVDGVPPSPSPNVTASATTPAASASASPSSEARREEYYEG